MTKQRLKEFYSRRCEVALLERRIFEMPDDGEYVTDVVRGSSDTFPYNERTLVIRGYGDSMLKRRMKARLQKKTEQLMAEFDAIEDYIESIDDSLTRQLITLRYVDGMSIAKTAHMIGYSDKHTVRLLSNLFPASE